VTATGWRFLHQVDGVIWSRGSHSEPWTAGEDHHVSGALELGRKGYLMSPGIVPALGHAKGNVLTALEAWGDSIGGGSQSCHRSMRIVRAYRWTPRDSARLAVFAAERAVAIYTTSLAYPDDERPHQAIEAAKVCLAAAAAANRLAARAASNAAVAAAGEAVGAAADAAWAAVMAAYTAYTAYIAFAPDPGPARAAYATTDSYAAACAVNHAAAASAGDATADIEAWLQARLPELETISTPAATPSRWRVMLRRLLAALQRIGTAVAASWRTST
jgi:hypothetical protein